MNRVVRRHLQRWFGGLGAVRGAHRLGSAETNYISPASDHEAQGMVVAPDPTATTRLPQYRVGVGVGRDLPKKSRDRGYSRRARV